MADLKPLAIIAALMIATAPAKGADFSDPTWPCVQRKVEELSVGLMWQHPIPDGEADEAQVAEVAELADALSLRRIEVEDLRPEVEAFAARHSGDAAILSRVFQRSFDTLSKRRTRIIRGIGRFSLSQIALAEQIDGTRLAMDQEMALETPDYDKVDTLEEKLDWDQVIYTDRQRSITYLCETPQLIERRLYAIAQLLDASVAEGG